VPASTWTGGLGFRHLIEDGVAILQDQPVAAARRRYVLDELLELIGRANRGSDLFRTNALFVASAERGAVESFSLVDRFLGGAESDHWKSILTQAEEAFDRLRNERVPAVQEREAAIELLKKILSGLIREPKTGVPNRPEEIRIGN
jgi:hypothetical protein